MKVLLITLFLLFSINCVTSQTYNEAESEIEDEIVQQESIPNYENAKYPNSIYGFNHLFQIKASNKDSQPFKRNSNNC